MNIQTLTLGPLATNCYLVRAEESPRAVIIDPAANSKRLLAALEAYPVKDGTQAVLKLIEDARKK